MAADYHDDAVLERGEVIYEGRDAIRDYFDSIAGRLDGGVVVGEVGGDSSLRWRVVGGPSDGASGVDTFEICDGLIVSQRVALDGLDF